MTDTASEQNRYFVEVLCFLKMYIKKAILFYTNHVTLCSMQKTASVFVRSTQYCIANHKYVVAYIDKTPQVCRYHTDYTDVYRLSNRVKIITYLVEIFCWCRKQFQVNISIDYTTISNIHTFNITTIRMRLKFYIYNRLKH